MMPMWFADPNKIFIYYLTFPLSLREEINSFFIKVFCQIDKNLLTFYNNKGFEEDLVFALY